MKGMSKLSEQALVSLTEQFVKKNVNSACFWVFYQAKLPKGCEKFKK